MGEVFLAIAFFFVILCSPSLGAENYRPQDLGAWAEKADRETREWLNENEVYDNTFAFLDRETDRTQTGVPLFMQKRKIFLQRSSGSEQAGLYTVEAGVPDARLLFHPDSIDPDGYTAISAFAPSPDGKWIALALRRYGSKWTQIHFLSLETERLEGAVIKDVKLLIGGFSWTKDSLGLLYTAFNAPSAAERYTAPESPQVVKYHRLGTPVANDEIVLPLSDRAIRARPSVLPNGDYIFRLSRGSIGDALLICAKDRFPCQVKRWIGDFTYHLRPVGGREGVLHVLTDRYAPRGRLVEINFAATYPDDWRDLIPESDVTLLGVWDAGDKYITLELDQAVSQLRIIGKDGALRDLVSLPEPGTVQGPFGRKLSLLPDGTGFLFSFSSNIRKHALYAYDFEEKGYERAEAKASIEDTQNSKFVTEVHYVPDGAGKKAPLFVIRLATALKDGPRPLLLYGYGGWNRALTPLYDPKIHAWLESGGVFAQAVLPGGGEFGEDWHRAGMKWNKLAVFEGFARAKQYLIDQGITSQKNLAVTGISNGGLLTAASLTRTPELIGASVVRNGAVDLLTIEDYAHGVFTMGPELGSAKDPAEREFLLGYSPLQQITAGECYPPALILVGEYDDTVVPLQGVQFAAALTEAQGCSKRIGFANIRKTGHSDAFSRSKSNEWAALELAFLYHIFGMQAPSSR